jgi:putative transposase
MCRLLEVSRSGFYSWLLRPESKRSIKDKNYLKDIIRIYENSYKTYGVDRIHRDLNKTDLCSRKRVARLMKENGIMSITAKKYKATTNSKHNNPVADNKLNQDFSASKPNEKWVTDITYIKTREGWLYLAAILDLYTKKIVGWSVSVTMTTKLVIDALDNAVKRNKPPKGVIHHSDRGVQYTSKDYQNELKKYGFICSMSRKGNCYDNACIESFWGTLKKELIYPKPLMSRSTANIEIFQYIEIFYNRKRINSTIGYVTPIDMEKKYYEKIA